jgi:uncharacterized protein
MKKMIVEKTEKLNNIFNNTGAAVIAFSGGVDSSFLLYAAHKVKKEAVIAVTIKTPYMPAREIECAIAFTKKLGIKHEIINIGIPDVIKHNPVERCYHCKKILFSRLIDFAKSANYEIIFDGSNADDTNDFRPGMKALKELGIVSPLLEAGLTKNEIRESLRSEGLDVWNMPAMACMLTRIPYNNEIKPETLNMIEEAEYILFDNGYPGSRVRIHDDVARIECFPEYIEKMIISSERKQIVEKFKKIGFKYVSLDMEGYRTGSMNPETLKQ